MRQYRADYNKRTASRRSEEDRARREKAKAFVDAYKAAKPCADCGRKFPPVALDLDHVRGAKIRSVSSLVSSAYKLDFK